MKREQNAALELSTDKPPTLGDVLYGNAPQNVAPESEWVRLVESVADRNASAIHALFERAQHPVYTLIVRLTHNPALAEELTVDVFHEIWRQAPRYDADQGTVLAWIMNRARALTLERLNLEPQKEQTDGAAGDQVSDGTGAGLSDAREYKARRLALDAAVGILTSEERQAVEAAFFSGLTHSELASRFDTPLESIETRIRTALHKLRTALAGREGQ